MAICNTLYCVNGLQTHKKQPTCQTDSERLNSPFPLKDGLMPSIAEALKGMHNGISPEPSIDLINHPPHYNFSSIEVIDVIDAWRLSYELSCVIKYIARADHKGTPIQDLEKAQWYIRREIENRKKNGNN